MPAAWLKTTFSPPDVSYPPSHSPHLHHCCTAFLSLTAHNSLSLLPGNYQWASWINFPCLSPYFQSLFYCLLSIIPHSCFPSALAFLPCIWSRNGHPIRMMQTQALFSFFFCFSSPSCFGFPNTQLSHVVLSFFFSSLSDYFLTWVFHPSASVFQVIVLPSPLWKLLLWACWERTRKR